MDEERTTSDPSEVGVTAIVRSVYEWLGGTIDRAVIEPEVKAAFARYTEARLTQFVPILVESRVRTRFVRRRSSCREFK